MSTSQQDIRGWLLSAAKDADVTHVIVVCDTFDHSDYPVHVKKDEDVQERVKHHSENMERVMEVYSMALDIETQLNEHRAYHIESPAPDAEAILDASKRLFALHALRARALELEKRVELSAKHCHAASCGVCQSYLDEWASIVEAVRVAELP